jgi:uncharacterized membrane protein
MTLLSSGLFVWVATHYFKRLAPGLRARMDEMLGALVARGIIAVLLLWAAWALVSGYRAAPVEPVYSPIANMGYLNNLLMLAAVALFGMGHSKGRARALLRHPMLTAAIIWSVAHLLVNGDQASVLLFGGIGLWAVGQMVLINRAEPVWARPEPGPASRDVVLVVITLVFYVLIVGAHFWLGYNPFAGSYA